LTKKSRKARLWYFDPTLFQPGRKAGIFERYFIDRLKSVSTYLLYLLALAYPVAIVSLGMIFGGLVFWSVFAGSLGLIWLVLRQAGYSRNFATWDVGYKKFLGVLLAFPIALAFYSAVLYSKTWPNILVSVTLQGITFLSSWTVLTVTCGVSVVLIIAVLKLSNR
jgi:hypothetical protein